MTMTDTETKTYTTTQVLDLIPGLSYRVLDYMLRTGAVALAGDVMPGSGRTRTITEDELRALRRLMARHRAAHEELEAIRDGRVWHEEIAS